MEFEMTSSISPSTQIACTSDSAGVASFEPAPRSAPAERHTPFVSEAAAGDFRSVFARGRRNRITTKKKIDSLEARITRAESVLIGISIAAIASGDYLLGRDFSIGYLYLIPLSYSALTHSWRVLLSLLGVCVLLRQWFGPLELAPTGLIVRDWILTGIFAGIVTFLHRLGHQRRAFFETARQQRDELRREIELAADVQRNLLARNRPPQDQWDIAARTYPLNTVGGDYYDFLPVGDGRLGVVIADVAGKGLPAAMLMPAVKIALRAITGQKDRIDNALGDLNQNFYQACDRANYTTLFFCTLEPKSRVLRYSNGGHNPALLLRKSGSLEWLADGGTPIGLLPDVRYETFEVPIESGDVLVLYTDGVTEAENTAGEQFGEDRLAATLKTYRDASAKAIVAQIKTAVDQFRHGAALVDDLTLIVIKLP